ncbi:serine hydrolase domain-containing protein [Lunatimonas salinarum]|uniref:serine hydrolase domain-containing protein n=1 Tax=Lunatimonas salinarum TaxID=1774590 RepID=UPI001AE07A45|nr:serine hydrolase [Lunatimonas salinarum]
MKYKFALLGAFILYGCVTYDENIADFPSPPTIYFPPKDADLWESISPNELGWNTAKLSELFAYLESNNTRAFIVLKDGKIAIEAYFGKNVLGNDSFDKESRWYWASAGKVLTATLVGIAQQEGLLRIDDPTSDYLGSGWTSMTAERERLITVRNQLTMTTGLSYQINDLDCTLPACLTYGSDAGNQWYYHNAPYTLLGKVVENAAGMGYNEYTRRKIHSVTGMSGQWVTQGFNQIYWSTARDMARFGLLILNKGTWGTTEVLSDTGYYTQMIQTSQDLNPSYGYLWWLNGKGSIRFPGLPNLFNLPLADNAPRDLVAGLGKDGQFVEIVPSQGLVVVRMGSAPDNSLVPILFHNEMWEKLGLVIIP